MAVFVNFAVEAETENAITTIRDRFSAIALIAGATDVAIQRAEIFEKDGLWYFFAAPAGLMHNGGGYAPGLNTPEAMRALQEQFYDRLLGCSGFRRAWFSYEALDFLTDSPDDDRYAGLPDMIVREDLVRDPLLWSRCTRFSDGYLRVKS